MKSHAQAFESLLALTPARDYFGSHAVDGRDPSEQWNRKKQSKEEKRAAKKAKLDPANQKSALDVLKEKEAEVIRKRKRKDDAEEAMDAEALGKRMKAEQDQDAAEARRREKAEKKKEKRERKKQKIASTKAKVEAKQAKKQDQDLDEVEQRPNAFEDGSGSDAQAEAIGPSEMEDMDFSGLGGEDDNKGDVDEDMDEAASQHSSTPTTPIVDSPAFDLGTNHSAASSSSSIVPPSVDSKTTKPHAKPTKSMPASSTSAEPRNSTPTKPADSPSTTTAAPQHKLTRTEAQDRLRARIQEMRAQRKADGADGQPARTRAELVDQRRQVDVKRKAAKKEQRQKEKEEESRQREEQLRGSGSPLSSIDLFSPRSPQPSNFAFSRLAFQDGTAATSNLSDLREVGRKKGPQDPKTALQAAQSKQSRLSGYDAEKRGEIEEKDSWINARKKAQGERVRDDTSLLKKALKRKEKQKSKSEKEWNQRGEDVVKGREMKQKKRDANLAKRKEEKGSKGKKKSTPKGKKVRRPGFEGRFKA